MSTDGYTFWLPMVPILMAFVVASLIMCCTTLDNIQTRLPRQYDQGCPQRPADLLAEFQAAYDAHDMHEDELPEDLRNGGLAVQIRAQNLGAFARV